MDPGFRQRSELVSSLAQGAFDGIGQVVDVVWQETRRVQWQVAAVSCKISANAELPCTERIGMRDPPLYALNRRRGRT